MKPVDFEYARARSIEDALSLLAEARGEAKVIAGAQSLGPMLNLRLVQPRLLVDITGIDELTCVVERSDAVVLGACLTSADVEDGRIPQRGLQMLRAVAAGTAYRAVRNRGTLGGSLCHADPASDWIAALAALGAQCVVVRHDGSHSIAIETFVAGAFETTLAHDELLQAIVIPRLASSARWGYQKLARKNGEFAFAIGAVAADPERGSFRAVIGATEGKTIVITDIRALCPQGVLGNRPTLDESSLDSILDEHGMVDPVTRVHHRVALERAFQQAWS